MPAERYASSEPGYRSVQFHNRVNLDAKLVAAGLARLRRTAARPGGSDLVGGAIAAARPRWRHERVARAVAAIDDADREVSTWGVLAVISALEDYVEGAVAELTRAGIATSIGSVTPAEDQDASEAEAVGMSGLQGLGISLGIDVLGHPEGSLLRAFWVMRHCVAHRDGRASKGLLTTLHAAADAWGARAQATRKGDLPTLPVCAFGRPIPLNWDHVILASDVARRTVRRIDEPLCQGLGVLGMIRMAGHHCLLSESPLADRRRNRSLGALIADTVTSRYRFGGVNARVVDQALRTLPKLRGHLVEAFEALPA